MSKKKHPRLEWALRAAFLLLAVAVFVMLVQPKPECWPAREKVNPDHPSYNFSDIAQTQGSIAEKGEYWFSTSGDSMSPTITDSLVCRCEKQNTYSVGNIVVYHIKTDEGIIYVNHRIVRKENGLIQTKGDGNPHADAWAISEDQIFCAIPQTSLLQRWLGM